MAGNITVIEPKDRYKRVSLDAIRNEEIDLFTLGLYTRILVRGKDWSLNINGLATIFGVHHSRIRKSICLLEREGYIRREPVRDEKTGKMAGWNYFIYAEAVPEEERTALPFYRNTVKPTLRQNRISEKQHGTNILDRTNRLDNTDRLETDGDEFVPSKSAIADYANEIGYYWLDIDHFFEWHDKHGWTNKKTGKPINWQRTLKNWKERDEKRGWVPERSTPTTPMTKPITMSLR